MKPIKSVGTAPTATAAVRANHNHCRRRMMTTSPITASTTSAVAVAVSEAAGCVVSSG